MTHAAFDVLAPRYDELWTNACAGRLQREAVWRSIRPLYQLGDHILDLGCGTGVDALRFIASGVNVTALDASPEMVRIARERGVPARLLRIEDLEQLEGDYDGAISNFGALNCISAPEQLRSPLARLIRPGGHVALCIIGRFCLWETIHFLAHGQPRKAVRRWNGAADSSTLGIRVFYPTVSRLRRALAPDFILQSIAGIGIAVPPSYVVNLPAQWLERFDAIDGRISSFPIACALADHRLLVFVRR